MKYGFLHDIVQYPRLTHCCSYRFFINSVCAEKVPVSGHMGKHSQGASPLSVREYIWPIRSMSFLPPTVHLITYNCSCPWLKSVCSE